MDETVTTERAAEIVSLEREVLRSYLKCGLLGSSGLMARLVNADCPAPDLSCAREEWKRLGFVDLCLMRLFKQLIDLGLSFEQANGIASCEELRRVFGHCRNTAGATLMAWPPFYDYIVFEGEDLRHLPHRLAEAGDIALLVQLDRIAEHVRWEIDQGHEEQPPFQSLPLRPSTTAQGEMGH